jgi:hypothetical protein
VTVVESGGHLTVSVDGILYIDQAITLPDSVLIGFTAGTGGLTNQHLVANVSILAKDLTPAPILAVLPDSVNFGNTAVTTTASSTIEITNWGNSALTITAITAPSAPFGVTGLPVVGSSIAPGAIMTATITFTPGAAGLASGSLVLQSNGGTVTVALTGTGTGG